MKVYGIWILPSTYVVTDASTKEKKKQEFPGHWYHDNKRMVFNTTSKGLAEAQAEVMFEEAEARDFDK